MRFRTYGGGIAVSLLAIYCGCSGSRGRVAVPDVDPAAAAEVAVQEYDGDADSQLDAVELKKCPALESALAAYDTDRSGALTKEEISAGITRWSEGGKGALYVPFLVQLDGRPLAGAVVKLIPVSFLGDSVKPGEAVADEGGSGDLTMSEQDRPANLPKNLPVLQPGLFRVEITHPTVKVPAKYNVESTLGMDSSIASQNPAGVIWALTTK
jgi:hypothetical protein